MLMIEKAQVDVIIRAPVCPKHVHECGPCYY